MTTAEDSDPGQNPQTGRTDEQTWRFHRDGGTIQGPLAMSSFQGRPLRLTLEPGQAGLLVVEGEVRSVRSAGAPELAVGGPTGVDPRTQLLMLDLERPLPVRWGEAPDWRELCEGGAHPRGTAGITIADPIRFHAAFLRHAETCDEPFLRRLIGTLVQSRIGVLLAGPGSGRRTAYAPTDTATLRDRLAGLAPSDLNASLQGYGIACATLVCEPFPPAAPEPAGGRRAAEELVTV